MPPPPPYMVPRSSGNWLDGERGDAPGPFLRFILWLYAVAAVLSMLGSGRTGGVPAGPESALAPAPAVPWATTGFKAAGAGTGGVAGMSAVTQFQQDGPLAAKLSQEPGVGGKRAGSILFGSGAHKANLVRRPVEVQVFMMTGFGGREDARVGAASSLSDSGSGAAAGGSGGGAGGAEAATTEAAAGAATATVDVQATRALHDARLLGIPVEFTATPSGDAYGLWFAEDNVQRLVTVAVDLLRAWLSPQALSDPAPSSAAPRRLPDRIFFDTARLERLLGRVDRYNDEQRAAVDRRNASPDADGGGAAAAGAGAGVGGPRTPKQCSEATACFLVANCTEEARGAYFVTPDRLREMGALGSGEAAPGADVRRVVVSSQLAVAAHFPVHTQVFRRYDGQSMAVTGALLSSGIGNTLMEMSHADGRPVAMLVVDAVGQVSPPDECDSQHPDWADYMLLFTGLADELVDPDPMNGFGMHISIHSGETNAYFSRSETGQSYHSVPLSGLLPGLNEGGHGFRHARTLGHQRRPVERNGFPQSWAENSHPSARGQTLAGRRVAERADSFLAVGAPSRREDFDALPPSLQRLVHYPEADAVAALVADTLWTYEELADALASAMANNRPALLQALRQSTFPQRHLHILLTEVASRSSRLELTYNHLLRLVSRQMVAEAHRDAGGQAGATLVSHPEALPHARWTLGFALERLVGIGWVSGELMERAASGTQNAYERVLYQLARLLTSVLGGQHGPIGVALGVLRGLGGQARADDIRDALPSSLVVSIARWARQRTGGQAGGGGGGCMRLFGAGGAGEPRLDDNTALERGLRALVGMAPRAIAVEDPELASALGRFGASSSGGLGRLGVALRAVERAAEGSGSAANTAALQSLPGTLRRAIVDWWQGGGQRRFTGVNAQGQALVAGAQRLGRMRAREAAAEVGDALLAELASYGSSRHGQLGHVGIVLRRLGEREQAEHGTHLPELPEAFDEPARVEVRTWYQERDPREYGSGGGGVFPVQLTDAEALARGLRELARMQAGAVDAEAPALAEALRRVGAAMLGELARRSAQRRGLSQPVLQQLRAAEREASGSATDQATVRAIRIVGRAMVTPAQTDQGRLDVQQYQQGRQQETAALTAALEQRGQELGLGGGAGSAGFRAPVPPPAGGGAGGVGRTGGASFLSRFKGPKG